MAVTGMETLSETTVVTMWVNPTNLDKQFSTMLGTDTWLENDLQMILKQGGQIAFSVNGIKALLDTQEPLPPAQLKGKWNLESVEDAVAPDVSGNGFNGILQDVELTESYDGSKAAAFNGSTSYISVDDIGELSRASLTMWIRPDAFVHEFDTLIGTPAWEDNDLQLTLNS